MIFQFVKTEKLTARKIRTEPPPPLETEPSTSTSNQALCCWSPSPWNRTTIAFSLISPAAPSRKALYPASHKPKKCMREREITWERKRMTYCGLWEREEKTERENTVRVVVELKWNWGTWRESLKNWGFREGEWKKRELNPRVNNVKIRKIKKGVGAVTTAATFL